MFFTKSKKEFKELSFLIEALEKYKKALDTDGKIDFQKFINDKLSELECDNLTTTLKSKISAIAKINFTIELIKHLTLTFKNQDGKYYYAESLWGIDLQRKVALDAIIDNFKNDQSGITVTDKNLDSLVDKVTQNKIESLSALQKNYDFYKLIGRLAKGLAALFVVLGIISIIFTLNPISCLGYFFISYLLYKLPTMIPSISTKNSDELKEVNTYKGAEEEKKQLLKEWATSDDANQKIKMISPLI